jgi:hypothetical protein
MSATRKGAKPDPAVKGRQRLTFIVQADSIEAAGDQVEDYLVMEDFVFESLVASHGARGGDDPGKYTGEGPWG